MLLWIELAHIDQMLKALLCLGMWKPKFLGFKPIAIKVLARTSPNCKTTTSFPWALTHLCMIDDVGQLHELRKVGTLEFVQGDNTHVLGGLRRFYYQNWLQVPGIIEQSPLVRWRVCYKADLVGVASLIFWTPEKPARTLFYMWN